MLEIDINAVTRIVISKVEKMGPTASRRMLIESKESGMVMINISMPFYEDGDSMLKIEETSEDEVLKIIHRERDAVIEKIY